MGKLRKKIKNILSNIKLIFFNIKNKLIVLYFILK